MARAFIARLLKDPPSPGRLQFTLPISDLHAPYAALRDRALSQGCEWGACVERTTGDDRLVLVHETAGTEDGVKPDCSEERHAPYLGFAHVHLPMRFKVGTIAFREPYPGFSDRDYRAALFDEERMSLVTNGDEAFAIVRTNRTPPYDRFSNADFKDWSSRYDDAVLRAKADMISELEQTNARGAASRTPRRSAVRDRCFLEVNEYLCRLLQFGFYFGAWGQPLHLIYTPEPSRKGMRA